MDLMPSIRQPTQMDILRDAPAQHTINVQSYRRPRFEADRQFQKQGHLPFPKTRQTYFRYLSALNRT